MDKKTHETMLDKLRIALENIMVLDRYELSSLINYAYCSYERLIEEHYENDSLTQDDLELLVGEFIWDNEKAVYYELYKDEEGNLGYVVYDENFDNASISKLDYKPDKFYRFKPTEKSGINGKETKTDGSSREITERI